MAAKLLLVKCYDRKKVRSLVDLTVIPVVGGELTTITKNEMI